MGLKSLPLRISSAACRSSACTESRHDPQINIWYFDNMSRKGLYNFGDQPTPVVAIAPAIGTAIEIADRPISVVKYQCLSETMFLNRPPKRSVHYMVYFHSPDQPGKHVPLRMNIHLRI